MKIQLLVLLALKMKGDTEGVNHIGPFAKSPENTELGETRLDKSLGLVTE